MSKKALVIYYSYSNGNIKRIAEAASRAMGADIAEIRTVRPYAGTYDEVVAQGQRETQEVMAGYLRGFGISLLPAMLTIAGICGVRIGWIVLVFPRSRTFHTIMMSYPLSLAATAVLIFVALVVLRPSSGKSRGIAGAGR